MPACDSDQQSKLETLKEMFPDNNGEEIFQALRHAQFDIRGAVNKLLFGLTGMPVFSFQGNILVNCLLIVLL